MFDPRPGEYPELPDFDELANHLLEQGVANSPSELHGCLAGLLGGGAGRSPEAGLDGVAEAMGVSLHGELADALQGLYAQTAALLQDDSMSFAPLLPDEDSELELRTRAMADWCRGFLTGYAHARVSRERTNAAVAQDSAEVLRDFAAIAQAIALDEDDEDAERAYTELVEYLRIAAMNVIMDTLNEADEHAPVEPNQTH